MTVNIKFFMYTIDNGDSTKLRIFSFMTDTKTFFAMGNGPKTKLKIFSFLISQRQHIQPAFVTDAIIFRAWHPQQRQHKNIGAAHKTGTTNN